MKVQDVPAEYRHTLRQNGGRWRLRHFRKAVPKRIRAKEKARAKVTP